jgi:hypothetical protein
LKKIFGVVVGLLLAVNIASAGGAVFWEVAKQIDIERGDANGISISDNGMIKLSPAFSEVFNTEQPFIFSSVADAAGNIYIGTGHEGRVYKIDKSGKGALLFNTKELDITALAVDSAGRLYAASSPDGKVYRIDKDGKSTVFFDPEDKYIWSMIFDKAGNLYVGTGEKGVLYKVDASGKGSLFAKVNGKHVISLALDDRGNLLAGTDPTGQVLRISPDGKVFALLDSNMREIHKLAIAPDGSIYALGLSSPGTTEKVTPAPSTSSSSSDTGGTVTVVASFDDDATVTSASSSSSSSSSSQSHGSSDSSSNKSTLYRITPDGGNDVVWSSREAVAFGLNIDKNGEILVSTGQKGRIYSIDAKAKTSTLLVQSSEEQTTTLLSAAGGLYATASNAGKLFRVGSETVKEGSYTSPVHDTKFTAAWGKISWRGNGAVEVQSRSGNTETPDSTWSDWSNIYQSSDGQQVSSPTARFIQWRAKLQTGAALTAVKIAYLPRNVAPEVTQITILPPSVGLQELPQQPIDPGIISAGLEPGTFGLPTNVQPRKVFQKGARSLQWQAEDRNGDTLTYSLFYRTVLENEWHMINGDFKNSYYTLDADSLPDGKYFFKVVASDAPSNSSDRALKGELVSDLVEIDNTPPQVTVGQPRVNGRHVEVTFSANDNLSILRRAEFSINGGPWQVIFPDDGIADSRSETYTVKTDLPTGGDYIIAFRCYDDEANAGGAKVDVKAGK